MATGKSITLTQALSIVQDAEKEGKASVKISGMAQQLVYDIPLRYLGGIQALKIKASGKLKSVNLYWAEYELIYP